MRTNLTCMAALAISLGANPASADPFSDLAALPTFYTDASMTTMKSKAEFKAAWDAMAKDKQGAMMKECQDAAMSKPHAEFCANLQALGGAK